MLREETVIGHHFGWACLRLWRFGEDRRDEMTRAYALIAITLMAVPTHVRSQDLESVLDVVGEFRIEESNDAFVEAPRMVVDPRGGWLYWDIQANQARLLAQDGSLRQVFGGPGQGPGEFTELKGVTRVEDGRLVTLDYTGRVAVWTESGASLLDDFASGVERADGLTAIGRNRIAIIADPPYITDPTGRSFPMLHFLNLDRRTVDASVLEPHLTVENIAAVMPVESPEPVLRDGLVFVAIPPFDTLWSIPVGGRSELGKMRLESPRLNSTPTPTPESAGAAAFMAWAELSTFIGRFFSMPDGGWVVQTYGRRDGDWTRGILRVDSMGRHVWEVNDTPELLTADPSTGLFYLWDPDGLDPGSVRVVRERRRGP